MVDVVVVATGSMTKRAAREWRARERERARQAGVLSPLLLFVNGSVDLGGDDTLLAHGRKHRALKQEQNILQTFDILALCHYLKQRIVSYYP